ncbi:MAG: DUF2270 domain-containing protein [Verrucomicrobiota bacterium]
MSQLHSSSFTEGNAVSGSGAGSVEHSTKLDSSYVTAMSHFYRGELGRIMAWRSRLDATTNWAITVTSTVFTVAFSIRDVPHLIFFFNMGVVWMLLWIEARRYRFYDAFRARVRLLEAHFIAPMVMQNNKFLQGDWQRLMCEDLFLPHFKISRFEALGRRLKRNYVYLFILILSAWLAKVFLHAPTEIHSWSEFYDAIGARHGAPAWLIVGLVTFTYVFVIGATVYIGRKSPGEFSEFGPEHRALWKL